MQEYIKKMDSKPGSADEAHHFGWHHNFNMLLRREVTNRENNVTLGPEVFCPLNWFF